MGLEEKFKEMDKQYLRLHFEKLSRKVASFQKILDM
jgi:hypothetical protein